MTRLVYDDAVYPDQFAFQRKFSHGRILNVGCNTDGAGLGKRGAVNLDLRKVDHVTGGTIPVDVLADARNLPFAGAFDCVVLGELLEHMERSDALLSLVNAAIALRPGGCIIVTLPHDARRDAGTLPVPEGEARFYAPGVYAYHYRSISRRELMTWIIDAGLDAVHISKIFYPWGEEGSGVLVKRRGEA
jgi:SAM-dependent methyltransferase